MDREKKSILEVKALSFRYQKDAREIWDNYSMIIKSNEIVGFIAPSGFGKTTFCKILAGYEKPQKGEILLDGKRIERYKGYCPVQMIWQHPEQAVNPKLKMKEAVCQKEEIEERILEGLGIEKEWFSRFPNELSGGELQRFCIARVLKRQTKFILADEISTMLDLITQSQIWHFLIKEAKERKMGILAVSHSEALLEKICTRIIRLE